MKQPVQRKLAAILAADVAGYSRLMGLDEAGTAQALREHRAAADPLIAEHGGRIVKTTGDGVLIEFGSVVGAVQCAVGLQTLAAEYNAGVAVSLLADLSFFELRLSTLLPKKPASLLSEVAGGPFLHSGVALAGAAVIRFLPRE